MSVMPRIQVFGAEWKGEMEWLLWEINVGTPYPSLFRSLAIACASVGTASGLVVCLLPSLPSGSYLACKNKLPTRLGSSLGVVGGTRPGGITLIA